MSTKVAIDKKGAMKAFLCQGIGKPMATIYIMSIGIKSGRVLVMLLGVLTWVVVYKYDVELSKSERHGVWQIKYDAC
jgi:hypothetical protein